MPTLSCLRDRLHKFLGREFTEKEFEDLCFEFGVELDEVTSEAEQLQRMAGSKSEGSAPGSASTEVLYKIDLPANRYDLLSFEGFVTALKVFLGKADPPAYRLVAPPNGQPHVMRVSNSVKNNRPFVICAVLRGVTFDQAAFDSFIDIQDKFHGNLAKKRSLASVGTHDLDTVKGPFRYDAVEPKDIAFVPLREDKVLKGTDFVEHYRQDKHLKPYLWMIEDKDRFPLVRDADGVVMSLPPIINSRHSQITVNTRNIFIEATAMDEPRAMVVVNQIICAFSLYCQEPFTIEPVTVEYEDGRVLQTPDIANRTVECSTDYIRKMVGAPDISSTDMQQHLRKMLLPAELSPDQSLLTVSVPPTRTDVLHPCDVMEDVAIAYGYERLARLKKAPTTLSGGKQSTVGKLSHLLRCEFANAGYNEVLSFSLCSLDEAFKDLNQTDPGTIAVKIANPQTQEFQMCRISLLPGLLKTLRANKSSPMPLKLFEVGDVVLKDPSIDVGARNERRAAALFCSTVSGFEYIHGLLDHIMLMLGARYGEYKLLPSNDPTYFPGRQAEVHYRDRVVGKFGVLHPDVLKTIDMLFPVCYLELTVDYFL
eukprot:TRINITY_DN2588_c0_g1_i1.p1 TRINITY_DN2588_c0_g1~~TRINITY_DN2588_c0_g1_i1.p1  ORF type:complete len:594 (-),score=156.50 TRINITY_DN2588_c0_g1_i1:343-2124(-)